MNRCLPALLLLGAALLVSRPVLAQDSLWTSRGLQGLSISSLVVDPGSPSRIYAAAGAGGTYRSDDGGESWTRVDLAPVEKLEIDERDGTIYAIVGERSRGAQALFRSKDRGVTWTKLDFTGQTWSGREWRSSNVSQPVWSIAVNRKEPGVLHAGHSGASVSTSRDGGATWSQSYFDYYCSDFCTEAITTLVLDPSNPSTVYAGIDADYDYPGFGSMFRSADGGKTWKESDAGIDVSSVYSIAADPLDSQRVLAGASTNGSSPGTFLSEDAGQIWRRTSNSASRALVFDPWDPQALYAGTDKDGVLRSVDRGRNWSPMNSGLPSPRILSLAIDRARGLLLAGTGDGVFSYAVAETRDAFLD
ncbi:MAG TPA: hypothetical protein VKG01_01980, partial [Thermoanaerobaculia bacterium]|nr:hypothetical protein [Thermoanaerobaculia bacterium]